MDGCPAIELAVAVARVQEDGTWLRVFGARRQRVCCQTLEAEYDR